MNKREIIERLKNIAEHAVHTVGEEPLVISLDDGIAVHEAIELLKKSETNCSEFPNNSDTISRQAVTKFLNDWLSCLFENCHKQSASDLKMIIKDFKNLPSAQPEQRWHPITEKPPRNKDLILKIYDKRNLFYYYHMGFYSAGRYFTYNFCWQYDEDLEVVGWQLCPWESR